MAVGYSTIEEAWQTTDLSNKTKINKKKPIKDPMCDLYEAKMNSNYSDTDLVRFANEYYDNYDKNKWQRTMKTQPMAYEKLERETSPKNVNIKNNQYDISIHPESNKKYSGSSLFEKQFEIKLPPLYETKYTQNDLLDDCVVPSDDKVKPSMRGEHPEPVLKPQISYKPDEYDYDFEFDCIKDEENINLSSSIPHMSSYPHMSTYAEVNSERNLVKPSSYYNNKPISSENKRIFDERRVYPERINQTSSERRVYPERNMEPERRIQTEGRIQPERRIQTERRIQNENQNPNFFDDYDDISNNYQTYKKKTSSLQILDIILYTISGIILIFLLEQFVKIGVNMGNLNSV